MAKVHDAVPPRGVDASPMVPTHNASLRALLTEREWQVLDLRVLGREYKEIASELHISESTVKNHISSIHKKLGVHNIAEAVNKAYLQRG